MTPTQTATDTPQIPPCDHKPRPYDGLSKQEVLDMRREFMSPAVLTYYKDPVLIVEGNMQWLFDETGRRYLDLFAGIVTVSVGHCHPKVLDAVREQNERLQHTTTIYLHENVAKFAKKLASLFPKGSGLQTTYVVSAGSEANDLAILMARAYTGNWDVIALRNGYHGMSPSTMGVTGLHTWRQPVPLGFGVHHARLPDCYRGQFGYDDPDAGEKYAAEVLDVIHASTPGQVAAFIAEPIQGVGGTVELPAGFLKKAYEIVRAHGGLCIADEVQTGFGRTGDNFWGFEGHGVTPDIVSMAKGIGNGAPLAAVTTRPEIADAIGHRLHFNTFGGNPVSCAQGLATIDVILEEKIQARAKEIGGYLKQGLEDIKSRHPKVVGDVRGRGLMLGMEFVTDPQTKEPDGAMCAAVFERAKELGVLVGKGGLAGSTLRIKPPMCITKEDCEFACKVLDQAITEKSS